MQYFCSICGSLMVIRERKRDKHKFRGCTEYPDCTGTLDIDSRFPSDYEIEEYEDYIKDMGD